MVSEQDHRHFLLYLFTMEIYCTARYCRHQMKCQKITIGQDRSQSH